MGIKHLLIDLPSVDREIDGGRMMSHRAFWNYPDNPRHESTITELNRKEKNKELKIQANKTLERIDEILR